MLFWLVCRILAIGHVFDWPQQLQELSEIPKQQSYSIFLKETIEA